MLTIAADSIEYVRVPVSIRENGVWLNPTADTVELAFPVEGTAPVSGDWHAATWETDTTTTPDSYFARALLGTGNFVLTAGIRDVWVRVTDNPELPVRRAGNVEIV